MRHKLSAGNIRSDFMLFVIYSCLIILECLGCIEKFSPDDTIADDTVDCISQFNSNFRVVYLWTYRLRPFSLSRLNA